MMPTEDPLADLPRLVREAPVDNLARLIGALAEAQAVALARLTTSVSAPRADDRLLTLPDVADILRVPEDYARSLARQRKIPTVRLPGLEKGKGEHKRTCDGKYVRVSLSSLRILLAGLDDKGIDCDFNRVLKSLGDRKRGPKDQSAA